MSDSLSAKVQAAKEALDKQVREIVQWHFSPDTGTPFWLEKAKSFKFNPLSDVQGFADLKLFDLFEDDWLRASPKTNISQWVPRAYWGKKPVYVFETGGTTGSEPVATTTCSAVWRTPLTSTTPVPASLPLPRSSAMPRPASQRCWPASE